ncbi:hypothetical protein ACJMK2_002298 [Sinanodonta woodiana]|uniref:Uncharacterized protein n=1 Tax=Sinanodonta woodiana TaxID=1069815 RepID=A0ABD3XUU6_SINWO
MCSVVLGYSVHTLVRNLSEIPHCEKPRVISENCNHIVICDIEGINNKLCYVTKEVRKKLPSPDSNISTETNSNFQSKDDMDNLDMSKLPHLQNDDTVLKVVKETVTSKKKYE